MTLSRSGMLFLSVFMLIVIEGALRKWVSNSLSLPLILLRDLLALWLVFHAWRNGCLRLRNKVVAALFFWSLLVMAWGLVQIVGGQSSPVILIIGLRFWLLYTWFAVAAAYSMNEADYRFAIFTIGWTMLLMAPLAVVQHFAPPGTFINAQTEGDEEGVFQVVAGVVRTTGTFSFTSGFAFFMTLAAPMVFGVLSARKRNLKQYLFAIALLVAFFVGALVSGSRTAVVSSGAMFGAYLLGRLMFSKMRDKPVAFAAVVVALVLLAVFAFFFQDAILATQTRFEQASEAEDFWGRVVVIFFGEPGVYDQLDFLGHGFGYGSNLANFVRTGATADGVFALAEAEPGRIMLEGGMLGMVYILFKFVAIALGLWKAFRISTRTNSPFPALVWLTVALAWITWTSVGQLTANGLLGVVLALGLLVFRYPRLEIFQSRAAKT